MILCDLPYGTTANKWDSVIPFESLWLEYRRIVRPTGLIVLTAAQPFTAALISSNPKLFRYELIWEKNRPTGFLDARRKPLRSHENILIFGAKVGTYNPQMVPGKIHSRGGTGKHTTNYGWFKNVPNTFGHTDYFPRSIVRFGSEKGFHPTQKPVALMEWLVKTYSNPSETVLDNCMGSGTTGVACANTGRAFIGIERDRDYFKIAKARIEAAQ